MTFFFYNTVISLSFYECREDKRMCVYVRARVCVRSRVRAAPPVSQRLRRFTKQIAANQIRALSRVQTQGEE